MLKVAHDPLRASRHIISAAAIVLLLGGFGCFKGWQTQTWPKIDGRILVSAVNATTGEPQRGAAPSGSERPVEIRYTYAVGGRDYVGSAIEPFSFGLPDWFVSPHQIGRYHQGAAVRVAYDPDQPAVAVLEPGPSGVSLMLVGAGILMGICGGWLRVRGLRRMEQSA